MEGGREAVEYVHPDAVVPLLIESLFQRGLAHDLPSGVRPIDVPSAGGGFRDVCPVRQLEGRGLAGGLPFEVPPAALFALFGHLHDHFLVLVDDALFGHHEAKASRVRESTVADLPSDHATISKNRTRTSGWSRPGAWATSCRIVREDCREVVAEETAYAKTAIRQSVGVQSTSCVWA